MNSKKDQSRRNRKSESPAAPDTNSGRTRRNKPSKEEDTPTDDLVRHKKLRHTNRNGNSNKMPVSSDSGTSEPSSSGASTPRPGSLETQTPLGTPTRELSTDSSSAQSVQNMTELRIRTLPSDTQRLVLSDANNGRTKEPANTSTQGEPKQWRILNWSVTQCQAWTIPMQY